jgi:AcrR family transcriptional regulator
MKAVAGHHPTGRPLLLKGEELPPAPRQRRSIEARERLKLAALELFAGAGFERTSVEEIAEQAGVAVGGFYLHFRSKRQLLLVLMDELLERLSSLDLQVKPNRSIRTALRDLLSRSFSQDLRFLGAYRAWQEATLSDRDLAKLERETRAWTTARVRGVLTALQRLPGARSDVDTSSVARAIDALFWALLAEAVHKPKVELAQWLDAATHLIYHAMFRDSLGEKGGKR